MDVAKGTKMYCDSSPDLSVMQWLLILNFLRLLFFLAYKIHQNRTRFIFFLFSKYITKKEKYIYLLLVHSKLCYSFYYVNAYHSVHDPTLQNVTTHLQFFPSFGRKCWSHTGKLFGGSNTCNFFQNKCIQQFNKG